MASLRVLTRVIPRLPAFTRTITRCIRSNSPVFATSLIQSPGVLPTASAQSPPIQLVVHRGYAKKGKKDRGGSKGKKKTHVVDLSPEEVGEVIDYDKMMSQLDEVLEQLKQDFIKQLSLRTNVGVFDNLAIETDDGKFPLNQLAQIVQKNPQLIAINLGPVPQYIPAVNEALSKSGMNINPQQDGNTIFVPLPKVTREHRESLAKNAKALCDRSKLKFKDVHNKYSKNAKKHKDVSEDIVHEVMELIHNRLHEYQSKADDLMHKKQEEILGGK